MMHSGTVGNTDAVSFMSVFKAQHDNNIILVFLNVHFSQNRIKKKKLINPRTVFVDSPVDIFSFYSPVLTPASTVTHHLIQEKLKFQSDSFKLVGPI